MIEGGKGDFAAGFGPAIAVWLCLALLAGCGGPEVLERPSGSGLVRVVVEENDLGLIDPAPAHAEAADICAETMQRAVYFRGDDLGDRRVMHFRCEQATAAPPR